MRILVVRKTMFCVTHSSII